MLLFLFIYLFFIVVGSVFYAFCVLMISSFFMENHISNTTLSSETMIFDSYRPLWCLQRCLLILDRPNIEWNLSNVRWQIKTTGAFFLHIENIWKIFFVTFSALSPGSFLTLLQTLKMFYFRKMIIICIHEHARDDNIHQFSLCSLVVNLGWLKVCRFNFKLCKILSKKFGHFWESPVRLFQRDSGSNKCTANHGYTVYTFFLKCPWHSLPLYSIVINLKTNMLLCIQTAHCCSGIITMTVSQFFPMVHTLTLITIYLGIFSPVGSQMIWIFIRF